MTKRRVEPIARGRVCLRPLAEADLPMTLGWRNQEHVRRWFINSDALTPEQHRGWFERYAGRDDDFVFVIEETAELMKPVGQVAVYNIDWVSGRAEFGRIIVGEPEAAGRGLAKEATALLLDFAFGTLGLEEAEAYIKRDNAASLVVFRACGFREAGERDGLKRLVTRAHDS